MKGLEAINLPIVLSRELQDSISKSIEAMPSSIVQYHLPIDFEQWDDYTELIPVGKIVDHGDFVIIIFWKAKMLSYEFILYSFDLEGVFIDREVVAGTYYSDSELKERVAVIDEDLLVFVATSRAKLSKRHQSIPDDAESSNYLIKDSGKIVQL